MLVCPGISGMRAQARCLKMKLSGIYGGNIYPISYQKLHKNAIKIGQIVSVHGIKLQSKTNSSFHMEILAFEYSFRFFGMHAHQFLLCNSIISAEVL
jgi:hypothetical protein